MSDQRRRKEFQRLDTTYLEIKFEVTKFYDLSPRTFSFHTTVHFKSLPHMVIPINLYIFVSNNLPFRLLHPSNNSLNTLTFLKYTAHINFSPNSKFQPCFCTLISSLNNLPSNYIS